MSREKWYLLPTWSKGGIIVSVVASIWYLSIAALTIYVNNRLNNFYIEIGHPEFVVPIWPDVILKLTVWYIILIIIAFCIGSLLGLFFSIRRLYWLKGGVTGLVVSFILVISSYLSDILSKILVILSPEVKLLEYVGFLKLYSRYGYTTDASFFAELFTIYHLFLVGLVTGFIFERKILKRR